jgi:predicted metal-dependent HD superfamily phosphohydrolase
MESKPGKYGIESVIDAAFVHPGYWKTLARLRRDATKVERQGSALRFSQYAFTAASVFPTGTVALEQIAEVNLGHPSQVRLQSGEILFVPRADKEAVLTFINQTNVPEQRRSSVWSSLLDPFLDNWEDQEHIDRQFDWFARLGLDREAVTQWRSEVAVAMMAYNFGASVWEWVSLDLYEALVAQQARLSREAFAEFYARAMRLATLDPVWPGWASNPREDIDGALHSVLLDWYPREKSRFKDVSKQLDERKERSDARRKTLLAELTAAYSETHRRYHVAAHIEHCLSELRDSWDHAIHLEEVRWALLFHDAVYDPHRQDNESRSADWACRVMDELGRSAEEKARVRALILATAHAGEPRTADEALMLDIDLSILGADEASFDEYDRAIRAEYEWVPEDRYRQARAEVLLSFLNRERVYHTALYRRRLEAQARANMQRALARLREG